MQATKAIREIMKNRGVLVGDLAYKMNKPLSTTSERLSQTNISVKLLLEMARVLGYKVKLVPLGSKDVEGGYDIE